MSVFAFRLLSPQRHTDCLLSLAQEKEHFHISNPTHRQNRKEPLALVTNQARGRVDLFNLQYQRRQTLLCWQMTKQQEKVEVERQRHGMSSSRAAQEIVVFAMFRCTFFPYCGTAVPGLKGTTRKRHLSHLPNKRKGNKERNLCVKGSDHVTVPRVTSACWLKFRVRSQLRMCIVLL